MAHILQALITGISGEVGTGLINKLHLLNYKIVAADIKDPRRVFRTNDKFYKCDISDKSGVDKIFDEQNLILSSIWPRFFQLVEKKIRTGCQSEYRWNSKLLEAATNQSLKATPLRQGFVGRSNYLPQFDRGLWTAKHGGKRSKAKGKRKWVFESDYNLWSFQTFLRKFR